MQGQKIKKVIRERKKEAIQSSKLKRAKLKRGGGTG